MDRSDKVGTSTTCYHEDRCSLFQFSSNEIATDDKIFFSSSSTFDSINSGHSQTNPLEPDLRTGRAQARRSSLTRVQKLHQLRAKLDRFGDGQIICFF